MKILHTADWHLGADYMGRSRHKEQAAFLDWLLQTVEAHGVEAVVVAGDIFDTAGPSAESLELYYRFLSRLAALPGPGGAGGASAHKRAAIVVGGNHDSPSRLDAPAEVLRALSCHVVGGYQAERGEGEGWTPAGRLVPLVGASGAVELVVAAVPYLHQWRLGVNLPYDAPEALLRAAMHEAFCGVYARLADKAEQLWPGVALMATGHLTCLGRAGQKPSAEDAIPQEINVVGTLGAFGPEVFDARYRYVALGHIHRCMPVDAPRRIWYAGSPVQVGVDEGADTRRVLLVDTAAPSEQGGFSVTPLAVPVTRRIARIQGPLEDLVQHIEALAWAPEELPPYLLAEATVDAFDPGARTRLLELAPEGPNGRAQVVEARIVVRPGEGEVLTVRAQDIRADAEISPEQAFCYAWRSKYGSDPDAAMLRRFRALLDADTVALTK